ncbi:MAG: T9SS type A sorting domain-containing protein [Rhodothermales bacterium]|nr:T9SS type A sorting domain-containing protein [Rhodothermales bacterium]
MNSHSYDRRRPSFFKTLILAGVGLLFGLGIQQRAVGQNPLDKGTEETFEIATWNIEWFGGANGPTDDARQVRNATRIIRDADIDLWALQEIADETAFATMIADLGGTYEGRLAPTSSQRGLGLAFVYKSDVVRVRRIQEILTSFSSDFAGRPPYQLEADVTVDGPTVTVTFIVVHMKAMSDRDSYDQRVAASNRLKIHIDFTSLSTKPVIILGDLNDLLSGSITSGELSPYKNFVDDPAYTTPTLAFQSDGRNTYCFSSGCLSGSPIDHIILSNEVVPMYVTDSADHFDELISEVTSYVSTTSDHLPALAVFSLTSTDIETEVPPADPELTSAYPNPFRDKLTVQYTQSVAGAVDVVLLDILGRTVARLPQTSLPAGHHVMSVPVEGLASGPYVLRVSDAFGRSHALLVARR